MSESVVSTHFGPDHAAAYDTRWARMAPVRDTLDFLVRSVLMGLPSEARVLCVGVGTGTELISLARAYPGWRFTAVEPSGAMLEVCRRKVTEAGLASRCVLHEGYLDSLPPGEAFDAATSLLVSQFLTVREERREFFRQIAGRLRPGGILVNADLATRFELGSPEFEGLFGVWQGAHSGVVATPPVKASDSGWGKMVAVVEPREVEAVIAESGFGGVVLMYQALFIHAWYARRS